MRRLEGLYVDIPAVREGTAGSFIFAVAVVALATVLRVAIDPYVVGIQFITFFPAVIITTFVCGWRAGVLSVVLCALAAWYVVIKPQYAFAGISHQEFIALLIFVVVAASDVFFIGAMRFAIRNYRDLSQTLERRVVQRTEQLARSQADLAQSQKLQAMGQLTGGLAHDFNNMLAIIIGNLDLMKRRLQRGQTDIVEFVDNAMEGGRRASQLTHRLLAFARNQPLTPAVVDLNKLVTSASELLRRTLGTHIVVECVQSGGLWKAFADPAQLESALVNLAVNARDAMAEGGKLTIETANSYLDDAYAAKHTDVKPGQYVVVAVSDTGVGMNAETVARAVEPFFTTKSAARAPVSD